MAENTKKGNKDNSKLLTTVVVIILCVFFVVGFVWGLNKVLAMEGSYPPAEVIESVTPDAQNGDEIVSHIDALVQKVLDEKPSASAYTSYSVNSDSIKTTLGAEMESTLKYIKGEFTDCLESTVPQAQVGFFEDFSSVLKVPTLTGKDIEAFEYIYYECGSCGVRTREPFERCENCNVPDECRSYASVHNVQVTLKNDKKVLKNNFVTVTNEQALAMTGDALNDVLDVRELTMNVTGLKMEFNADRETDKLSHLDFRKTVNVTAKVQFKGKYASLGEDEISFELTRTDNYNFTWPALVLSEKKMTVEPKKSDNLLATLICDDPLQYTVTWSSSDESVVTVDDEGYFKGTKQTGKAIITASYEFGGQTYTDECEVEVKIPVESLKMSKKKLELNKGETAELKVSFSPKKATVQTLKWYTEDESIATVDENGVVTATGTGVVSVYALSDDGYFKSSSEVTVK
ncbi:MAG: Ig-like domain-containing protein [Clostridia bacterium]|nr:Ig-like domain-containing protein [Clostridia bacterium]